MPDAPRPRRARIAWPALLALLAIAVGLPIGCGPGAPPPVVRPPIPREELPYLVTPSTGAPEGSDADELRMLDFGFQKNLLAGDVRAATEVADTVLQRDAESAPAQVLLGQSKLVGADLPAARATLAAVAARFPGYTAAQLALGRAADRAGDAAAAYGAYRAVAGSSAAAAQRASELLHPAAQELYGRVTEAIGKGRLDAARDALALLQAWAPSERNTMQAALAVAHATGDARAELDAVRALLATDASDEAMVERRGELELAVGQPQTAIRIFEDLGRRHPGEARFAQQVERAKFRFRVANLPSDVARMVDEPELSRAEFAVLLYWLVPGVRAAVVSSAHIASDILEHPRRQEIMRVVNLELMDVDDRLRQFSPDARLRRGQALKALARVLQRAQPPAACVGSLQGDPQPSREALCAAAATCGMLEEPADCLADGPVSGSEAAEWIRRTLALLPP